MITEGNFRLTGIKQNDITSEIENIIDNARSYLFICGYNFTSLRNPKSILKKVIDSPILNKHCVLPITLYRGQDANRSRAIELVRKGVSVSIENKNHSKWIMSENEIYYGSANFSMDSLENKIEVATFRTFPPTDNLKTEFINFIQASMVRMTNKSNRKNIWGVIKENDRLTRNTRTLIHRLNPSIEKVIKTVDSINTVRSQLLEVIENSFWYLDDKRYYELTKFADTLDNLVKSINYKGNALLNSKENSKDFKRNVYYYNSDCDKFLNQVIELSQISQQLIVSENIIPSFTTKNRKLIKKNLKMIE